MAAIVPHVWQIQWEENGSTTILSLAFTIQGQHVCGLRIRSPDKESSWSGWHGYWYSTGNSITASFHWRGSWSRRLVTRCFHHADGRSMTNAEALLWFQKGPSIHFAVANGVLIDRPQRRMLEDQCQWVVLTIDDLRDQND